MPARTYMEIDPRRDHGFRVPRPDVSAALGTPDACTGCHRDRSDAWAAAAVVRWYGPERAGGQRFAQALAAGRGEALDAHARLEALRADASQPAIARATALRLLAQQPPVSAAAVRAGLADADPLVRMAALEAAEALEPEVRLSLARASLRDPVRAVRIQAAQALTSVPPALWQGASRADFAAALDELRAAHRANADQPEGLLALGALAAQFGDLAEARRQIEAALRLAPWSVPAAVNLADLDRLEGRDDQGEAVLERALAAAPQAAALHHALGLLRVRQKRLPEALESLRRAAELEPGTPRYPYVYGLALESAGQGERALAVLAAAQERRPGDRDLLVALATIHRDRGDLPGAIRYARLLVQRDPEDAEARALLGQLAPQAGPQAPRLR